MRLAMLPAVAAGPAAWHWLPLLAESAELGGPEALTGGIFDPARNVLGSASAHALHHNIWLGWVAVGLLTSVLLTRSWRHHPRRTAAAIACIVMASPIASPLWRLENPPQLLQFPWRWLLPASLVLVPAPARARVRRTAGIACVVLPSLLMVWIGWMRVSDLEARQQWHVVGGIPLESLGANPPFVDAAQSRPSSFGALRPNLRFFGECRAVVASGVGTVAAVHRWSPLLREVEVVASTQVTVGFRILDYPSWAVSSDDSPEIGTGGVPGVVSCHVPEGRHRVSIRWVGNPRTARGQMAAALTVLLLIVGRRNPGGRAL